jgi:hypothetical protein
MKVKKEQALFSVLMGSHLYGTATVKSDFDYKVVCLPSLSDLIMLKRVTNKKEKPEGMKAGDKMVAGETETEYVPLQVYFDDFFNGQTYALEMAFAAAQGLHTTQMEGEYKFWQDLNAEMLEMFLTKNVKKMVGYAVSQSKLYGLKTERYTAMKEFVRAVEEYFKHSFNDGKTDKKRVKLKEAPELLARVQSEFVKPCTVMNAKGGKEASPGLEVAGKMYPETNTWFTVVESVKSQLANYGERVKEFDGEGVDWKALSHAVRITEQVLELTSTGKLTFPRPNAYFLREVKNGQVPLNVAQAFLEGAFKLVDEAVTSSKLPERTPELEEKFQKWKLENLSYLYGLEL